MPSKFTRRLGRRGVLSAKRGNANYYKGSGARNEGVHTNKGEYARHRQLRTRDRRSPHHSLSHSWAAGRSLSTTGLLPQQGKHSTK